MKKICLLFFLSVLSKSFFAQLETNVTISKKLELGYPIEIEYLIVHDKNETIGIDFETDSIGQYAKILDTTTEIHESFIIEPISSNQSTTKGKKNDSTRFTLSLIPLDTGIIELEGIQYSYRDQFYDLPKVSFQINYTANNESDSLVDIYEQFPDIPEGDKNLKSDDKSKVPWWVYLLYSLLGIGLISGVTYWYFKKKKKAIELTPYEMCLNALVELENQKLWRTNIKEFYTQLSQILRVYVSEELEINLLEKTTAQCGALLKSKISDKDLIKDVLTNLNLSDLVKFAASKPNDDIIHSSMNQIKDIASRLDQLLNNNE